MEIWRDSTVFESEDRFDEARNPCRCFEMAYIGFDRPDQTGGGG
jgi:hypothetical protein